MPKEFAQNIRTALSQIITSLYLCSFLFFFIKVRLCKWLHPFYFCVVDTEHCYLRMFFSSVLLLLCITEQLCCWIECWKMIFQLLQNIAIKNLYIKDDGSGPSDKTVGSGGKQAVREAPGTELLHRDAEMFPQLGRTFASPCGWRAGWVLRAAPCAALKEPQVLQSQYEGASIAPQEPGHGLTAQPQPAPSWCCGWGGSDSSSLRLAHLLPHHGHCGWERGRNLVDLKLPGELLLPRCPQINECFHHFGTTVWIFVG